MGSVVNLAFASVDGSYVGPRINIMTQEKMVCQLDSFRLTAAQRRSIEEGGYRLSDIETTKDGRLSVDLVIGLDYLNNFTRGTQVNLQDGLTLHDTVFGYFMSGLVEDRRCLAASVNMLHKTS